MRKLWEKGKEAYKVLGECVEDAIADNNAEMAIVCGYPLLKLAEAERATYFGYEGAWDYNRALELAEEAVKLADKEGVPSWMEGIVDDMRKTIVAEHWKKTGKEKDIGLFVEHWKQKYRR